MSIKIGDTVADYEVLSVLGTGGMGRVYKVRNVLSNRFEAMKVLLPESIGTADRGERFLREIQVQASLDHPNIAALRTALRIEDQVVMIMEFVEGTTLHALMERGRLPLKTAITYLSQALAALSYAHQHGVIHRDIKPSNIMLARDGTVKLTDFGIARKSVDRSLTSPGATMGSIFYMSPEQVNGNETLDGRSDLYSLGVTLYEAATGARPFQADNDYKLFSAHLNEPPVPPRQKNPGIPPELDKVILKSLAKSPADRFQTADEFREALQSIQGLAEETSSASTATIPNIPATETGRTTSLSDTATSRQPGKTSSTTASLEMAYVLFMDIVAYSSLHMDRQSERITELVEIVRNTDEYRRAQENDQIISLPTGDGMALVFFSKNPAAAVECASEISRAIRNIPEMKLRMGVHTGPVYRIPDINASRNVAGGGINMAQRVMDCGDAGHILVSKAVADVLGQLSDWAGYFHDLGEAEVKHGVKVHIVNFVTPDVGNSTLPQKLQKAAAMQKQAPTAIAAPIVVEQPASRSKVYVAAGGLVAVLVIAFGVMQFTKEKQAAPGGNSVQPVVQTPSQPSAPASPPPPAGTTSAVAPPGQIPPSNVTAGSSAPPAAASMASQKAAGLQAASSKQAAPAPPPGPDTKAAQNASPASTTASAQQSGASAEDRALLQEQRERMILLGGRGAAVRGSVENLERQQNRSGLSLRPDMAAAKESMNYLFGEAKASMAAGDAATTKRNLDLAEQQVEKLERFLGR